MKKVAILQSNYIPWKGYFDIIASVDEFIVFDEMQFTKRDWRNRNLIKTPVGKQWLTVPVKTKDKFHQKICETEIDGAAWKKKHLNAIRQNYSRSRFFKEIYQLIEPIYLYKKSFTSFRFKFRFYSVDMRVPENKYQNLFFK